MTIGTRSVLFGAHCFFLHPMFVAASWFRLYGFKIVRCSASGVTTCFLDPLLWVCFFVHDLGYIGKPNMDGEEGELHPYLGARLMRAAGGMFGEISGQRWHDFALLHSRFLARREGREPSLFCWADKYAITMTPSWLYLPLTMATGELEEYMKINPREVKGNGRTPLEWHKECRRYCGALALEHRDGRRDTWTPSIQIRIPDTPGPEIRK